MLVSQWKIGEDGIELDVIESVEPSHWFDFEDIAAQKYLPVLSQA